CSASALARQLFTHAISPPLRGREGETRRPWLNSNGSAPFPSPHSCVVERGLRLRISVVLWNYTDWIASRLSNRRRGRAAFADGGGRRLRRGPTPRSHRLETGPITLRQQAQADERQLADDE